MIELIDTELADVKLLQAECIGDDRGFFMECFRADHFRELGLPDTFVQDNHSGSKKNVLRGLHYQLGQPQGKLIRAIAGEVFDVAVDLRPGSDSFGRWTGAILSSENRLMMWVPAGFAHGFYVLSDWAETEYKCTAPYWPQGERSLLWSDPQLAIRWPLAPGVAPLVSAKDAQAPVLAAAELP